MQEFWEVLVTRSKIQFKPAASSSTNSLNGLNGFKLSLDGDDDLESYVASGYSLSSEAGSAGANVANEPLCWNCLGFGHTKNDSAGNNLCAHLTANFAKSPTPSPFSARKPLL